VLCAPWFVLVSLRNPEFAWFFFVHEHFQRFLTTEHRRAGPWWYFVPLLLVGLVPWTGLFFARLPAAWRDTARDANGFSWPRFCLAWVAFVFLFFSASGSKLPSYILPLFPAAALLSGRELARIDDATMRRVLVALAASAVVVAVATFAGYERLATRLASPQTPLAIYEELGPWVKGGLAVLAAASIAAFAVFRSGRPAGRSIALVLVSLGMLAALQLWLEGNDAFRVTRSSAGLVQALRQGPYDASAPFYQVRMYDQTLPFYLHRTTTVVAYRDELALGLDAQPEEGIPSEEEWQRRWLALPQGYALLAPATFDRLRATLPMREIARDPRRVLVARQ
jgi:4-amino-4-deoxy-L-arabinose transferase-like glycosyltransferase